MLTIIHNLFGRFKQSKTIVYGSIYNYFIIFIVTSFTMVFFTTFILTIACDRGLVLMLNLCIELYRGYLNSELNSHCFLLIFIMYNPVIVIGTN